LFFICGLILINMVLHISCNNDNQLVFNQEVAYTYSPSQMDSYIGKLALLEEDSITFSKYFKNTPELRSIELIHDNICYYTHGFSEGFDTQRTLSIEVIFINKHINEADTFGMEKSEIIFDNTDFGPRHNWMPTLIKYTSSKFLDISTCSNVYWEIEVDSANTLTTEISYSIALNPNTKAYGQKFSTSEHPEIWDRYLSLPIKYIDVISKGEDLYVEERYRDEANSNDDMKRLLDLPDRVKQVFPTEYNLKDQKYENIEYHVYTSWDY